MLHLGITLSSQFSILPLMNMKVTICFGPYMIHSYASWVNKNMQATLDKVRELIAKNIYARSSSN